MRIHVIGINYWPDETGIAVFNTGRAEYLAACGHQVTMCTGVPYYPQWRVAEGYRGWRYRRERRTGVDILRCPMYVPARVDPKRRVLHEASFLISAFLRSLCCRRPDLLVVVSPPLGLALVAAILGRLWRVPFVFHVADLQPDTALDLGMMQPGRVTRLLYAVERLAYRRAALVSTLTGAMRDRIVAKGTPAAKVLLCPDWADPALFDLPPTTVDLALRQELGLDDAFLVLHAGNMGVKQGLDVVLDAAARSRDDPTVTYVLVGDGAVRPALEARTRDLGLPNLRILPLLPHDRFLRLLTMADLCLVTQQPCVADIVFPSKVLTLLAAAKPVIASVNEGSEVARVVAAAQAGAVIAPDDAAALQHTVDRLRRDTAGRERMAENGRRHARIEWDRGRTLQALRQALESVAAAGRPTRATVPRHVPALTRPGAVTHRPDARTPRVRGSLAPARRGAVLLYLLVAWGVLSFGAVYAWAHVPLLLAAAAVASHGWDGATREERAAIAPLGVALLALLAAPTLQLLPIPLPWLVSLSPATDGLLQRYDLVYMAARGMGEPIWHPISIAPWATLQGLGLAAGLAVFLVGGAALVPRIRLAGLVRAIVATSLVLAVFGIVQKATFNGQLYWFWTPLDDPRNAFGPFVNRNHFAGWMVMATSLGAGYFCGLMAAPTVRPRAVAVRPWLASVRGQRLLFVGGALAIMALSIVWTLSRSGIAALGVAVAILAMRSLWELRGMRRFAAAAFLVAIVAAALVRRDLATVAAWFGDTDTLVWRLHLWRDTMAIVRDAPWFGTGLNTFGITTLMYPMSDASWHAAQAHSDYLQILSEGGVSLVLLAVIAVGVAVVRLRRAYREPQSASVVWIRTGATAGLAAMGVQEAVDFSLQIPGNAVLFVLLAAIALHRARPRRRSTGENTWHVRS